jgi:hypothetical protein
MSREVCDAASRGAILVTEFNSGLTMGVPFDSDVLLNRSGAADTLMERTALVAVEDPAIAQTGLEVRIILSILGCLGVAVNAFKLLILFEFPSRFPQ